MKSLKNKRCKICGKPAEVFLPNEDDEEEPYCLKCADSAVSIIFEVEDDDED